jgi:6-phosphofructokinase
VSEASPKTANGDRKKIGIMTGGGDAPGLNGIIESTVRALLRRGFEVVGIRDGFDGIFNHSHLQLTMGNVTGIHSQAGTILGTSNKSTTKGREVEFLQKYNSLGLDGLIACGGDGTFAALKRVSAKIPLIGVPKTIDNDLQGTEVTFGFDTACAVVAEAADSLRATANAHSRVLIVETMGRTSGWIALGGGLASYADVILVPELPFSRAKLLSYLAKKKQDGHRGLIIVASEGAAAENESAQIAFRVSGSPQAERYGGFSEKLARWIEENAQWEARHVVLGHLQRSRAPTTTDRFLTLAMGVEVARLVQEGAWNHAVVYRDGRVTRAPIEDLMQPPRLVPPDHRWLKTADELGIFTN